ncbi:hypothetical protein NLJ89_g5118 [Agrocybe chaxingu]|uniref:3-methyl-2-oxobutanoate hydroxymethyltransferase n=1 Tax=Agrocybe chaxingu TaxID=84603 RepID=A0A9W8K0T6_9AGAR|nr:hypothetical protein NLJ89_g5118 [Agrocybe chaxingu]
MSALLNSRRRLLCNLLPAHPKLQRWMSVRPPSRDLATPLTPPRKKVTLQTLQALRESKTPITMLTAYDYPTAQACSSSSLTDITLVGDSLAQVCLGYTSTAQLTLADDDLVSPLQSKRLNR